MSHNDQTLFEVKNLKTWFGSNEHPFRVVDDLSFDLKKGETFALLGESGCGKSMTALSLMQLVPAPAGRVVSGQINFQGQDLLQLSEQQMRSIRGKRVAMIFQEPMTSLNPVMTVGEQIIEVLRLHFPEDKSKHYQQAIDALDAVGIPDPTQRMADYSHQLSGGMKQRVMIAIALAAKPDVLIADEPTTALDVTIQAQVMDLLHDMQKKLGMSILLITHDLGIVADRVDRLAVMYAGQLIEQASREQFFENAAHPYSQKLFAAVPGLNKREQSLEIIKGSVPPLDTEFNGCRFADRCEQVMDICSSQIPEWHERVEGHQVRCHLYSEVKKSKTQRIKKNINISEIEIQAAEIKTEAGKYEILMQAKNLKVHFPIHQGLFKSIAGYVYAVDDIDLQLYKGRTLALVGESGCGKTTVGKALLQLVRPTHGSVKFQDTELTLLKGEALRKFRAHFQIIFQDPFSSLNPRMMVGDILEEGMLAQGIGGKNSVERQERIDGLLQQVGLPLNAKFRYPHEFSGGQRQRISIARALAVQPDVLVCDEPTSALDVSVQAQTLNLLKELQNRLGLSYLFISHNISVVEYLAHEVAVMYLGRIVEKGLVDDVIKNPAHPYTQALLSAVPVIDKEHEREVIRLEGELPSPINPPQGCHFHPRCPKAIEKCKESYPRVTRLDTGHEVRCFLFD